ncbi:MAG: TAXI family TRAP transporter solute-binding subunit [Marivibrio sp.]|uniref:TAXI family TRAP transporter solute-binding subunit n=1 Tax=Marivibrio sp. TaxID=2039719 RepID=UPI0032EC7953
MLAALAAAALGLTPAATSAQDDPSANGDPEGRGPIQIGGGVPFGLYFPLAGAICQLIEDRGDGARSCRVAALADSAAAIDALRRAEVDMALVQSDWLAHAVAGTSRFQQTGALDELRAVASLHGEGLVILMRRGEAAGGPQSLEGMRVSRGPQQSYRALLTYQLLRAVDLSIDDLAQATDEPVREGLAKLCRGETDAVAAITARPAQVAAAAPAGCALDYLPIDERQADGASQDMPGVAPLALPLDGDGRRLASFGMTAVLTADASSDPDAIERAARGLIEGAERLARLHPALAVIAPGRLERAARVAPLHPAADAVYRGR